MYVINCSCLDLQDIIYPRQKLTGLFVSVVGKSHFYVIELALRTGNRQKMREYTQVLTGNNLTVLGKPETN